MEESVFTRIIKGELPSHKVYEDDVVYALMDIHPVQPGHIVVVPKKQVPYLWDIEDEDYMHLMGVVKKLARKLRSVSVKDLVCMKVEGLEVAHAHIKLIPFTVIEDLEQEPHPDDEPDHTALAEWAEKLKLQE